MHMGRIVTWEEMLKSKFELCPNIDQMNENSTPLVEADFFGCPAARGRVRPVPVVPNGEPRQLLPECLGTQRHQGPRVHSILTAWMKRSTTMLPC